MSNSPDPENISYAVRLNRFTKAKLDKCAKRRGTTPAALVRAWIDDNVQNVTLTEEEYDAVLAAIAAARDEKRNK